MEADVILRYSRLVAGRRAAREGEYLFEWRSGWEKGPISRDLAWQFEEPDQYPAVVAGQKPGMMAAKTEKVFHAAVSSGDPDTILQIAGQHPKYQDAARTVAGLLLLESQLERGIALLDEVIASGVEVRKDPFLRKYLPDAGLTVTIAAGVAVHLPLQANSLTLLVAELHQARGEEAAALQLLEKAEPTTHVRLSQTELLFEAEDFERILAVTQGVINDDDVTALTLAYRGRALAELERYDEAVSVFARTLEYPNRASSIRAIALVGRGMVHQVRNEHVLAGNDFTEALMEVPDDEEARQHIEKLIRGESADS